MGIVLGDLSVIDILITFLLYSRQVDSQKYSRQYRIFLAQYFV